MVRYSNVLDTLTPKHVYLLPAVFFHFHLEERWVWVCKLGEELNANNDK